MSERNVYLGPEDKAGVYCDRCGWWTTVKDMYEASEATMRHVDDCPIAAMDPPQPDYPDDEP